MGDIGDDFREWKQHRKDAKAAEAMGCSIREYHKRMALAGKELRDIERERKLAKHTIQCECGRTFLDQNAHNYHKQRTGKKGHKGSIITKEPTNDQL